jgi:hypothetical protein
MPQRYITARLAFRRGTKEKWESENPTLSEGEPGLEIGTGRIKIGDGETGWNELNYYQVGDSESPGTFIHNGELIPDYVQSVSSAIEYLGHQFKILNEAGIDDFNSGVSGGSAKFLLTVASGNGGAASHSEAVDSFDDGTVVSLNAVPFGGYEFENWEGPVSDPADPNATITVTSNVYVRAHFKILGS